MVSNRLISSFSIACIAFVLLSLLSSQASAQAAESINYQAVVRNSNGVVLKNQVIQVQFSIIDSTFGVQSVKVYQELFDFAPSGENYQTNDFGLINLRIGEGFRNGGTLNAFSEINWGSGNYFLQVEFANGGNPFENLGTTQLVSVPYALYAKSSGDTAKAGLGIQVIGKDSIVNIGDLSDTNELITSIRFLNDSLLIIEEGLNQDTVDISSLRSAIQGLRTDSVENNRAYISIIGGSQINFSVADGDSSATNEIQTLTVIDGGDSIQISNNQGLPASKISVAQFNITDTDNQQLSLVGNTLNLSGDNVSAVDLTGILGIDSLYKLGDSALVIVNANQVNDTLLFEGNTGDVSATNELVDSMKLNNGVLELFQQGTLRASVQIDTIGSSRITANAVNIALNNDTSMANERVDSLDITSNDFLRVFENGLLSDSLDLSRYNTLGADTNLVSAMIVGDSIQLNRDLGLPVYVNITDLVNEFELASAVSTINSRIDLDNDTSMANERVDSLDITSNDFLRVFENGVLSDSLDLSRYTAAGADTNLVSALIVGDSIQLNRDLGLPVHVNITDLVNEFELASVVSTINSRIDLDNDTSATNEKIGTIGFNNTTRVLTVTENRVNYTATIPLSTLADTNIISGSIVGANIALLNDQGETVNIDIANLSTDLESAAAVATEATARQDADGNLSTRIVNDSTDLANAILSSGNLETRFENDSVLQDADSVRLDNFVVQYDSDTIANGARVVANATAISTNTSGIGSNILRSKDQSDSLITLFAESLKSSTRDNGQTDSIKTNILDIATTIVRNKEQSDSLISTIGTANGNTSDIAVTIVRNKDQSDSLITLFVESLKSSTRDNGQTDSIKTNILAIASAIIRNKEQSDSLIALFNAPADNLGDHIATQRLDLGTQTLVGNGGTNGIEISNSGNVGVGVLTIDSLKNGSGYTFPGKDGTADQVMVTDGSGNVNWSAVPIDACPVDMVAAGVNMCIETVERTASDWFDAATACVADGYKLPTWAEWYAAAATTTVTTMNDGANWEWIDGGTFNTARKVGNGTIKATATDNPETGSEVFRCVTYK